ncbi:MAG: hypothetical protein CL853_05830 [Crocinitomicaceae bacterium]|nr:hypothetical protein [Crocinitomicaceae bacterium]|tara:strand:- start:5518 stop:6306 length:789 start_codon:yes stop_codon:yes gene_type:complete
MKLSKIDIEYLNAQLPELKKEFNSKTPFRYIEFENFFKYEVAEEIYINYPKVENKNWDGTTYIDQKNKFTKTKFKENSIFETVFNELNSNEFLNWLEQLTNIEVPLISDEELFGGGLHQSINGAFLNVHVDYNIHPKTKFHRRLNVIVYMNKDWKEEYEGALELWDTTTNKNKRIENIFPTFNKCVIFETNEISFHGHPKKLNTPKDINRKSLATYYYSKTRPETDIASEHNTIYVNTQGIKGGIKRFSSGFKALKERVVKK